MGLYNKPANIFVAGFIGTPAMNFVDGTLVNQDGEYAIDAGSFKVVIPEGKDGKKFASLVGKPVVFGVRPEDIFDKSLESQVKPTEGNTIKVMVDVLEPMGSMITAYITSGEHTMIAALDAETRAEELKELEVVIDMEKTHLFDKETELLIY